MTISDDLLIRYADGETSAEEALMVEAALAADAAVAERLAAHQRVAARVKDAFAPVRDAPVPQAMLDLLNTSGPLPSESDSTVVPLEQFRARKVPAPRWMSGSLAGWAAMAACLVIGVMVGTQAPWGAGPGLIDRDQNARGALMAALDGQLASQPPAKGESVRVGVSFRKSGGGVCRTYSAQASAGLACREGGKWKVMVAVAQAPAATGEFRTAASEIPPVVLEAMDSLIIGEPLDATGEAAAKKAGWR